MESSVPAIIRVNKSVCKKHSVFYLLLELLLLSESIFVIFNAKASVEQKLQWNKCPSGTNVSDGQMSQWDKCLVGQKSQWDKCPSGTNFQVGLTNVTPPIGSSWNIQPDMFNSIVLNYLFELP